MIVRKIGLAAIVIAFATGNAAAQTTGESPLRIGDQIRIRTPESPSAIKGTLVAADDTALILAPEGRDRTNKTFAPSEITKLEVARGKKKNVVLGAVLGAALGLVVYGVTSANHKDSSACDYGACIVLPAMGAAAGALVGLVVKTERWESVPPRGSA